MAGEWKIASDNLLNALNAKSVTAPEIKKELLNLNKIKQKIKAVKEIDEKQKQALKKELKDGVDSFYKKLTACSFCYGNITAACGNFKDYLIKKAWRKYLLR